MATQSMPPSALTSGGIAGFGGQAANGFDQFGNWVGNTLGITKFRSDPNAFTIPGYDAWQAKLQAEAQAAQGRTAPQINTGPQDQFRTAQTNLAALLQGQAAGTGPSVAATQLQRATDSNIANTYATAAAINPNDAGALRNVANQRGVIQQQSASDAAQLRAQEQMQAQNQLGQLLAGARGQDIGVAGDNANLQFQQAGLNDAAVRFYLGAGMSLAQAQQQAAADLQKLNQGSYYQSGQAGQKLFGGIASGAGSALGLGSTGGGAGAAAAGLAV